MKYGLKNLRGFLLLAISLSAVPTGLNARVIVSDLKCEYRKDPVGLGVVHPRLSWILRSEERNQVQTAFQILVASSPEGLKEGRADLWSTGKVDASQSIQIEYNGKELRSRDQCWWKVRVWDKNGKRSQWSETAYFEIGLLTVSDWQAEWMKSEITFDDYSYPSPMFRKEFSLDKKIHKARLYITSLGFYEAEINGKKVGDALLRPGFTSYDKRVQYQVYDIGTILNKGSNAIGIVLGNGWYRNYRAFPLEAPDTREWERKDLLVLAQLEVYYEDGQKKVITTGPGWKSSTGPILMTSIYNGETYDARLEQTNWSAPGFDESQWQGVEVEDLGKQQVVATIGTPVRNIQELKPIAVIITPEKDTLLDFGQNMAGWCRLRVNCQKGTVITLKHGEVLDKSGNFYTENLRSARQTIRYTCKGGGTEIYEPRFTFQGFRYVAISGYPGEVTTDLLTGIVIHSDMEKTGYFTCSESLVNKLNQNILWTMKGNYIDIPTDDPQRDERMGWAGDAMYFSPTASFHYQVSSFFSKWLKDLAADQDESGMVYHTVPNKLDSGGAFGWCDAAVVLPWILYRRYNDTRILEEQYESMKGWVDYQFNRSQDMTRLDWYGFGDWLAWEGDYRRHYDEGQHTDKDLLGTAYFYHSTDLFARTARLLGRREDADKYRKMAEKIKLTFNQEFVTPRGRLSSSTQTAYAVALSFGLLPEEKEALIAKRLAENVRAYMHITTGLLGTREISHVLTDHGYVDEAYILLFSKAFPSWLYQVEMGATTIWERWDGIRPDSTFQKAQMNSLNQPPFGVVGDWLYRKVAGIDLDPEIPGFKAFMIKPFPGGKMKSVRASHDSPYGLIGSAWSLEEGIFKLRVEIPVNTTARIYVPSTGDRLNLDGQPAEQFQKVRGKQPGFHFLMIEAGSGVYHLESDF